MFVEANMSGGGGVPTISNLRVQRSSGSQYIWISSFYDAGYRKIKLVSGTGRYQIDTSSTVVMTTNQEYSINSDSQWIQAYTSDGYFDIYA